MSKIYETQISVSTDKVLLEHNHIHAFSSGCLCVTVAGRNTCGISYSPLYKSAGAAIAKIP